MKINLKNKIQFSFLSIKLLNYFSRGYINLLFSLSLGGAWLLGTPCGCVTEVIKINRNVSLSVTILRDKSLLSTLSGANF